MKKRSKRLLCVALAAATMLSMSVTASAEIDNDSGILLTETVAYAEPDDEGYVLISEEESKVGEYIVVDRTYVLSGISVQAESKGSATFKRSRSIYENEKDYGKLLFIMWVQGTFTWNREADTAYISSPKAWIDPYELGTLKVSAKDGYPKYGSNKGATFLFGKKYAYIEYIVVVTNDAGFDNKFRLWLDVDIDGDPHVKI